MYCFGPHRWQIFFGKTQPKGTITIAVADGEPPLNPQRPIAAFPSEPLTETARSTWHCR
jgi:hypothetical protein